MYTNPKMYKVMSVILLVFDCLSVVSMISVAVIFNIMSAEVQIISSIPEEFYILLSVISYAIYAIVPFNLFFAYMKFSSTYTFGNLAIYERSGSSAPFKTRGILNMPAGAYQKFGYIIFMVEAVLCAIAAIVLIIAKSIETKCFISIPLIPIAVMGLSLLLTYITYYVRYKTFGDVLSVAKNNGNTLTTKQAESLRSCKTGILRGYCVFMFVLCIIELLLTVVGIFLLIRFADILFLGSTALCIYSIFMLILGCAVCIANNAVTGCFFDHLGGMTERLQIKHNLIDFKNYRC